jgi:hypothetical protein
MNSPYEQRLSKSIRHKIVSYCNLVMGDNSWYHHAFFEVWASDQVIQGLDLTKGSWSPCEDEVFMNPNSWLAGRAPIYHGQVQFEMYPPGYASLPKEVVVPVNKSISIATVYLFDMPEFSGDMVRIKMRMPKHFMNNVKPLGFKWYSFHN